MASHIFICRRSRVGALYFPAEASIRGVEEKHRSVCFTRHDWYGDVVLGKVGRVFGIRGGMVAIGFVYITDGESGCKND